MMAVRRTEPHGAFFTAVTTALLLLLSAPAAQAQQKSLQQIESDLAAARAEERRLAGEADLQIKAIEALKLQLADAALATQRNEGELSAAEARLAGIEAEYAARRDDFAAKRDDLADLLNALQRLARTPKSALVLLPASPIDTARAGKLLGAAAPPIEDEARELAGEVAELRRLQDGALAQRAALQQSAARLADSRSRLDELVDRRAEFYRRFAAAHDDAAAKVAALATQAEDLRDLLRRLDDGKAAASPPPTARQNLEARVTDGLAGRLRRLGAARGQMAFPARGRVVAGYGQAGTGGQPNRGLLLQTRPQAQIVAPFDGQIAFAGPFRGYGRILIIEHGEGYHTLLAGLGRIDVSTGQIVTTGEPIATAGEAGSESDSPLDFSPAIPGEPVLYVELRYRGQPINPLPWLAASNEKVSG